MVGEGQVAEGLAIGIALADRSADARLRFRARVAVAKMALDGSKADLARPMLEHLLADVERYQLESWEPALCATLYSYLFVATKEVARARAAQEGRGEGAGVADTAELAARQRFFFDKLCRLDPASAIKLST